MIVEPNVATIAKPVTRYFHTQLAVRLQWSSHRALRVAAAEGGLLVHGAREGARFR